MVQRSERKSKQQGRKTKVRPFVFIFSKKKYGRHSSIQHDDGSEDEERQGGKGSDEKIHVGNKDNPLRYIRS
jgi:hypothetical protein